VQQSQRPVAWISLDQGDNEPTRFLAYLLLALQSLRPDSTGTPSALPHPPLPALNKGVLTQLVNEIARHSTSFFLVLDDYHLITESQIHEAMAFILEHMPPNMHLMIISRQDPPLPLTRLRAQGQLVEIRQADLRFTRGETAEFLNAHTDLSFTQEDIAALETRTEGWAVGLQLAAIALQSSPLPGEMVFVLQSITSSNRFILDYLVEEVLLKQPAMIQDFLLKTAILDHLSGSLCDAVVEIDSWRQGHEVLEPVSSTFQVPITSQQILDYLDRANLFIIPLDYARQWYRYHTLFVDLLRQRLGQQLDREAITHLHQRASFWYEENGRPFKAIEYALAADDYSRTAHLIETYGQQALWEQGLYVTVTHWLDVLPEHLIASNPSLALLHAIGLSLVGKLTSAEKRLQMAEHLTATLPADQQRVLVGQIIVARLYIVSFFNLSEQPVEQLRQALDHIHPEDMGSRGSIMAILGHTYGQQGKMNLARQTLAEAIQLCQQAGNMVVVIMAVNMLIMVERARGKLSQTLACCRQALDISTQALDNEPSLTGITLLALGEIQYQRNELDDALESLTRGIQLALQSDTMISQHAQTGYIKLARVRQAQGDHEAAEQALAQAQSSNSLPQIRALASMQQARIDLNRGNLDAAEQWANDLDTDHFAPHTFDEEMSTLVRVQIARSQTETALEWLTKARAAAQADGRFGDLLEITVLEALAFQAEGKLPAALNAMADALSQSRTEGYVRLFLDEGPAMINLLRQAVKAGIMPDYATQLLTSFPIKPIIAQTQPLPEFLSTRELDVLRLMVSGYSNPEIARELVVSVGTIKTHTSHIYSKLNARNRAEAVKRAIDLKLV
jgi:LuxR family maltose regulon positive regulatory protein